MYFVAMHLFTVVLLVVLTVNKFTFGNSDVPSGPIDFSFWSRISRLGNFDNPYSGIYQCGKKGSATNNRDIVGGSNAKSGEFPWYAGIVVNGRLLCGGTIISPNWVLTAAHCTEYIDDPTDIEILYDTIKRPKAGTGTGKLIAADKVIEHEEYTSSTLNNDLALIHVKTPFQFGKTVSPVCLPWNLKSKRFEGIQVIVSGFGSTVAQPNPDGEIPNFPKILQKATVGVVNLKRCTKVYKSKGYTITDTMICAFAKGKDTCNGDSGGPMEYYDPSTKRSYVIGVTSFGHGCAHKRYPGVYTNVGSYLNWIQSKTSETFCKG